MFQAKKNSPHIFFVGGTVGIIATVVMACRSTLKLSDTLDDISVDIKNVKVLKASSPEYAKHQYSRDMAYVYSKATWQMTKLYGPPIILGAVSIGALTGSHVILTKRNTALMVAYATVTQAFNDYRDRVRAELGSERELEAYRGIERVVEHDQRTEDGKIPVVKQIDPNKMSIYARCFDESSTHYEDDAELNKMFILCQQNLANDRLQAHGHVFLNEVYDWLGLERSGAGSVCGWRLSKEGDNYIDFGIFEARSARFVNGNERSIWLDFNVDGVIWNQI